MKINNIRLKFSHFHPLRTHRTPRYDDDTHRGFPECVGRNIKHKPNLPIRLFLMNTRQMKYTYRIRLRPLSVGRPTSSPVRRANGCRGHNICPRSVQGVPHVYMCVC